MYLIAVLLIIQSNSEYKNYKVIQILNIYLYFIRLCLNCGTKHVGFYK